MAVCLEGDNFVEKFKFKVEIVVKKQSNLF